MNWRNTTILLFSFSCLFNFRYLVKPTVKSFLFLYCSSNASIIIFQYISALNIYCWVSCKVYTDQDNAQYVVVSVLQACFEFVQLNQTQSWIRGNEAIRFYHIPNRSQKLSAFRQTVWQNFDMQAACRKLLEYWFSFHCFKK